MKPAWMLKDRGLIWLTMVPVDIKPTGFSVGTQYTLGHSVPLDCGEVPACTKLTVSAHDHECAYVSFDLDHEVEGLGDFLEILPEGSEEVVEAINEGIRRDQRHLHIDPSIVQIRSTVVRSTPVSDLWTNNGVTIDANHSPEILWTAPPDGMTIGLNPAGCAEFNMPRGQNHLAAILALMHQDDRTLFLDPWLRSVFTGEPYQAEGRVRGPNSEYYWYKASAVPVFQNGKLIKWCGVNTLQKDHTTRPNMMDGPLWWGRFAHTSKAKVLRA